jgi:hypothetical protein
MVQKGRILDALCEKTHIEVNHLNFAETQNPVSDGLSCMKRCLFRFRLLRYLTDLWLVVVLSLRY